MPRYIRYVGIYVLIVIMTFLQGNSIPNEKWFELLSPQYPVWGRHKLISLGVHENVHDYLLIGEGLIKVHVPFVFR